MDQLFSDQSLCLPSGVKYALFQNPDLGVCVVSRDKKFKMWSADSCRDSVFTRQSISKMILSGQVNDFVHDFVLVDKNGENCGANFKVKTSIDENGFIHINDTDYLVKVVEDANSARFIGGRNVEEIEKKVRSLIDMGIIKKPIGFTAKGFKDKPIFESPQKMS